MLSPLGVGVHPADGRAVLLSIGPFPDRCGEFPDRCEEFPNAHWRAFAAEMASDGGGCLASRGSLFAGGGSRPQDHVADVLSAGHGHRCLHDTKGLGRAAAITVGGRMG